jgi:hypothetical protein
MRHSWACLLLTGCVLLVSLNAHALDEQSIARNQMADWWGYWFQKDADLAARLKNEFDTDWARRSARTRSMQPGENPSEFNRRVDFAQASYLCQWKDAHAPPGNPKPLYLCDASRSVAQQVDEATKASQAAADSDSRTAAEAREAAERAGAERVRVQAQQIHEKEAADAAKREAEFTQHVSERSNTELCGEYYDNHYRAAREELRRRKALTAEEWQLVERGQIRIGVSELALVCSFGRAPANRTVTAAGARKQYVYGDGETLVYVEDGRVVAFQDRR